MLIETITFDIHDFKNNTTEQFLVSATEENYEMILAHHFTRNIKFTQTFNFQFEKEMRMPIEMISEDTWMRMVELNPELAAVAELETVN